MNLKEISNRNNKPRRIFDMSRIGFLAEFNYEVYIRTDDGGNIPHVHIWDKGTKGKEFSACVKLTSPEYFPHGGKYTDIFNSKQKKAFVEFINSIDEDSEDLGVEKTVYEVCCWLWNKNNSKMKVRIQRDKEGNPIIPDYTKL